jgi:hypothetical protein
MAMISYSPWMIIGKIGDKVYDTRNGKNFTPKLPVRREETFRSPYNHSGYNKAISANLKNGFIGAYPELAFDFRKLLLAEDAFTR